MALESSEGPGRAPERSARLRELRGTPEGSVGLQRALGGSRRITRLSRALRGALEGSGQLSGAEGASEISVAECSRELQGA
eukprot:937846-Alexandrium_andersonii.AAC.1